MYKSKLQILCQSRKWELPEYTAKKSGPEHNPSFSSTVTVNGAQFSTVNANRTSKEAQNNAAKVAFEQLTGNPSSISANDSHADLCTRGPSSPVNGSPLEVTTKKFIDFQAGLCIDGPSTLVHNSPSTLTSKKFTDSPAGVCIEGSITPVNGSPLDVTSKNFIDSQAGLCIGGPSTLVNESPLKVPSKPFIDSPHIYKNRLQNYALKKSLTLPAYACEREGPPHASRFRCTVTFQGRTSEFSEFYSSIKEAEYAAAKKAWEAWSLDEVQQDDTALFKNLLQEYLQRVGCSVPKYETTISGPPHIPVFVSKVKIQGCVYEGQAASSKKQAESHAAKVAYTSLKDQEKAEERKFCRGLFTESQPDFSSGYDIKEALEKSASILQSIIALPPKVTPNTNLLVPAERSEEHAANTNEVPPPLPETNTNANRLCLPSSDAFDFNPSALSLVPTNSVNEAVGPIDPKTAVVVLPRTPNMTFPAGATILPFSDDKWVALKLNRNQ